MEGKKIGKTITMKDVAKRAGVGVGTVSRFLNNGSVKESTRLRIQEAILTLDYQPNYYARGLKTNQTYSIALIIPSIWHPFFSEFAYYVENDLEKNKYKMYLCNSSGNSEKEREYIQMVQQNKVDGIIGITYSDIDAYISNDLPFVSIDRYFTKNAIYVTADNIAGGRMAAQELVRHGATHLAYIGGYQETPNETRNRRKYFEMECQEQNIPYAILDMLEPLEKLDDKIEAFLLEYPAIDGIFTINDSMALYVKKVLEKLGKQVPQDVQIIGFDGQRPREEDPYLVSTIAQPIKGMAQKAVELLLREIGGETVEKRTVLPVSYKEGGTTRRINPN